MYSDEYVRRLQNIYSELDMLITDAKREIRKIEEYNPDIKNLDKERIEKILLLSLKAIKPLYHILTINN